jgi:hypothetical protein
MQLTFGSDPRVQAIGLYSGVGDLNYLLLTDRRISGGGMDGSRYDEDWAFITARIPWAERHNYDLYGSRTGGGLAAFAHNGNGNSTYESLVRYRCN